MDAAGVITGFYYCGDKKVDAQRLGALIGLPVAYLDIEDAYKKRQVDDLLEFLSSDALSAVFHEHFAQRHRDLMAQLTAAPAAGTQREGRGRAPLLGPATLKGVVQGHVLDFVKQHQYDLPAYVVPDIHLSPFTSHLLRVDTAGPS